MLKGCLINSLLIVLPFRYTIRKYRLKNAQISSEGPFSVLPSPTGNVTLNNTYHNCIVLVKNTATITVPYGLTISFNCVFDTWAGATATFVQGTNVDVIETALTLSPLKMASLYQDSSTKGLTTEVYKYNTDVNVLPLGVCVAGSVNRHLAGEKEFKKRLPRKEELQSMPCINWLALNVEGYDVSGNRVYPTFELEDLRKPIYLGKNGDITFDKPLVSEYNTPIGYIASSDTIVIDLENRFPKHQTPVTKN